MSKPMTKTQLVAALAEDRGTDKKSAGGALEAICNLITREVAGGGAVTLPGLEKSHAVSARSGWCAIHLQASSSKKRRTRWLR